MRVKVLWHGHANFQIATTDFNVLIDPFFTDNPSAVIGWEDIERPDLVLVTHLHADHSGDAVEICNKHGAKLGAVVGVAERMLELGLEPELLLNGIGFNMGGTVLYKNAAITMTEAHHTSESGAPAGYIITLPGGFTVYHAGDTCVFRNMKTWGELYKIDLALLPAGGVFTMDKRQAALAAGYLQSRAVIPMHWGTFPALSQNMDGFDKELSVVAPGCRYISMQPGETVEF